LTTRATTHPQGYDSRPPCGLLAQLVNASSPCCGLHFSKPGETTTGREREAPLEREAGGGAGSGQYVPLGRVLARWPALCQYTCPPECLQWRASCSGHAALCGCPLHLRRGRLRRCAEGRCARAWVPAPPLRPADRPTRRVSTGGCALSQGSCRVRREGPQGGSGPPQQRDPHRTHPSDTSPRPKVRCAAHVPIRTGLRCQGLG